jgi:hypothetical protein
MKIAYVHILPIEYYPPATNLLRLLGERKQWEVRAWTSPNSRGMKEWAGGSVRVLRHDYAQSGKHALRRFATYLRWHFATARELARWKPDVIISIEPHSAIAVWLYLKVFAGSARLFIHHHEYYAPADFLAPGMRLTRLASRLEKKYLFQRAEWISQTNGARLGLVAGAEKLDPRVIRVLPNFPPREWVDRAVGTNSNRTGPRKLIYLGSASLEDTFIAEAAGWVADHTDEVSFTVAGNNIAADVWSTLAAMNAPNISVNKQGWDYETLPEMLKQFDVGLILYKGNTRNFVYNIPNKVFEYLAAGLEVWYPPQMRSMQEMHSGMPELPMTEVDFENIPDTIPDNRRVVPVDVIARFTAESALRPLIEQIERGEPGE